MPCGSTGWAPELLDALPVTPPAVGEYLGVQGYYPALPAAIRNSGTDPDFGTGNGDGHHSVTIYYRTGPLVICDPLVPKTVNGALWMGQPVTWAQVQAYFRVLPGAHVVRAKVGEAATTGGGNVGADMAVHVDDPTPMKGDLATGVQLYELDCVTPRVKVSVGQVAYSPFGITLNANSHYRAVAITTGGARILLAVHNPDITNLVPYASSDVKHMVTLSIDGNVDYTKAV